MVVEGLYVGSCSLLNSIFIIAITPCTVVVYYIMDLVRVNS